LNLADKGSYHRFCLYLKYSANKLLINSTLLFLKLLLVFTLIGSLMAAKKTYRQ